MLEFEIGTNSCPNGVERTGCNTREIKSFIQVFEGREGGERIEEWGRGEGRREIYPIAI